MKYNLISLIYLLLPLAFANEIHQPSSFRVTFDKNEFTSLSIDANLRLKHEGENLIISSSLGNMEIKKTNESFIVESVPSPSELSEEPEPLNGKENEKYDMVNDKIKSTTEQPAINCMESELKELIVKCDGNIRLRKFTDEERKKIEESRKEFRDRFKKRMEEFEKNMREVQERLHKSIEEMRSRIGTPIIPEPNINLN